MASGTINYNFPFSLKASIPEISDKTIDELVTPGVYYLSQSSGGMNLNLPEGINGFAIVIGDAGNRRKQFFTRYGTAGSNDGNLYVRRTTNATTYGPWWRFTGERSWAEVTGSSPDSITEPGVYYIQNSTALPEGTDGFLWVVKVGTRIKQIYSRYGTKGSNDGNIFIRDDSDGGSGDHTFVSYGPWWVLTGEKIPSGYTYTNRRGCAIPENTSLQSITELGTYYSPNTSTTSTITGKPASAYGAGFTLKVERIGAIYRRVFIDGRAADSRMFVQQFSDATTYSDWYQVSMTKNNVVGEDYIVESFSTASSTVAASQSVHLTCTCTKTGYTPMGILGITKSGTGTSWAIPYEWNLEDTTCHVRLRNFYTDEITVSATVDVLMRKDYL